MSTVLAVDADLAAAAAAADQGDAVSYRQYVDIHAFATVARPLLHHDIVRNTLCLTHLDSLKDSSTNSSSRTLALLSCSICNLSTVIVAADNKGMGYSTCYASAGVCRHTAAQLASLLQQQLRDYDKITLTSTAAALLSNDQEAARRWQLDHLLHLMVYESSSTDTQQQQQQQQQQDLVLQQCSIEKDASLVVAWSANFLQDVFGLPESPPEAQVQEGVMPRLQKGSYYALYNANAPVCLVAHTPSSTSSTRVTMVYTPPEHRGHGYAKTAVHHLLQHLQSEVGYSSICLFADKDKPHIGAMYQSLGFSYFDELHTLKRLQGDAAA